MSSDLPGSINLLKCDSCHSTGISGWWPCPQCAGMAMARAIRGKLLYWSYPLTRYHLMLARGRRILDHIRWITALVLGLNAWIWGLWRIYSQRELDEVFSSLAALPGDWSGVFEGVNKASVFLFWLGVAAFSYVWYRSIRKQEFKGAVERHEYKYGIKEEATGGSVSDWKTARKFSRRRKHNIADAYTLEAKAALAEAYKIADDNRQGEVSLIHLFYALLSSNRISNIFIRLGLSAKSVQERLRELANKSGGRRVDEKTMPLISDEFRQALFAAYEEAYAAHQPYVSVTELLLSCVRYSKPAQELLFDFGVDSQKLANVAEWARIRERLYRQYVKFSQAASHRSKKGMDKAMTALSTPYLNQFGEDMTMLAQFGHLDPCIARDQEIEEIFRVVEGGEQNVLLVGEHGVGKRSIIEGLAQRMMEDDVPKRLRDKRLVRLSIPSLLGGATPAGAIERLQRIGYEIARAGNVILFVHNLHELSGVSAGTEQGGLDVADTLAETLGDRRFLTLATTTNSDFSQHILNTTLGNVFTRVDIAEMDANQAIQVLESKVGATEHKHQVFFSYSALEKCVLLSARYMHDTYLPGTALQVMSEAASFAKNKKGEHSLVTAEEVAQVVAEKTGIPVTAVTADESSKLLNLEQEMHQRVIGQDEGVEAVANALRRARAEIRSTKRPIANFLFMGPTGVGKTELAKTIAHVYFGGEERMIRLDMSEYQDKASIHRLIGVPGEKSGGILTEAVRRNPFSLLLLDEIEKADADVLNIFLQVMDDGRLTDGSGRVIDFTNVILIATSNAGTSYIQEQLRSGVNIDSIKGRLLHGGLKQYFKPEFLNRFDGIIVFKPLDQSAIRQIAALMIKRIAKDLEAKGIELKVEPAALEYLAQVGFDPEFGARPMRRALEERVENNLASLLLSGKLRHRDVVVIGEGGKIRVE